MYRHVTCCIQVNIKSMRNLAQKIMPLIVKNSRLEKYYLIDFNKVIYIYSLGLTMVCAIVLAFADSNENLTTSALYLVQGLH
jgi:hypothetical protein